MIKPYSMDEVRKELDANLEALLRELEDEKEEERREEAEKLAAGKDKEEKTEDLHLVKPLPKEKKQEGAEEPDATVKASEKIRVVKKIPAQNVREQNVREQNTREQIAREQDMPVLKTSEKVSDKGVSDGGRAGSDEPVHKAEPSKKAGKAAAEPVSREHTIGQTIREQSAGEPQEADREKQEAAAAFAEDEFEFRPIRRVEDVRDLAEPVIVFEHVCKDYPSGTHAIRDLSLTIRKGEFVFLVGSSGSGKSTFIRLLLKEIEPSSGRLYVNSKELTRMRRRQVPRYRRGIGVVFQNFRLLKDRSVFENVAFAQRIVGVSNVKIRRNVKNMLNMVELADRRNAFPKELSGGEQQRVAIARALVNNPVILLADEPTGNLDPKMSWEIMKLLDEINKKGTTVVVVTHNREIVDRMQKRVITLNRGVLVSDEKKGGYTYEH